MKKFLLILLASGFSLKINGSEIEPQKTTQPNLRDNFTITRTLLKDCKVGATCPEGCPLGDQIACCLNATGLFACIFPSAFLACVVEGFRCCLLEGSETAGIVVGNLTKPVAQSAATILGAIRVVEVKTDHHQTNHYINSQLGAQDSQRPQGARVINPDDLLSDALNN